jgi:hypothetical protein
MKHEMKRMSLSVALVKVGAELGFQIGRMVIKSERPGCDVLLKHRLLKNARAIVADFKRSSVANGSCLQSEVNLYERGFELALKEAQLAGMIGTAPRPIRIFASGEEVVIKDQ